MLSTKTLISNITQEAIEKLINPEEIWSKLLPRFKKIGESFSIRNESLPSAQITFYKNNLWMKDFGDPNQSKAELWFQYVMREYNLSYFEALEWVLKEFKVKVDNKYSKSKKVPKKSVYDNKYPYTIIKIKPKKWTSEGLSYWDEYGIYKEQLERKKRKQLQAFWIINKQGKESYFDVDKKLSFVYPHRRDELTNRAMYKILSPYEPFKWISNINKHVVQNEDFIPKSGELLFIQSSWKDCDVMENIGNYAIAPNGEGMWFTEEKWDYFKTHWKQIIIFGNNDWHKSNNPGLNYAKKHSEKYKIPYIITPGGLSYKNKPITDISDYRKAFGHNATIEMKNNLLNALFNC